jgi:UDP-glucuronate 4-epimerase
LGYLEWETHQHIYQGDNNKDLAHDFTYIDNVVKTGCVPSLDVLDKSRSSGGMKTGHVGLCIFNLGMLVLQTLLPTLVDILEKYLNLKSKREIVKMPSDGDVPFTNANIHLCSAGLAAIQATNKYRSRD